MNSNHQELPNRPQQLKNIQNEGYELFKRKNKDYGDSFATYGPIGVIVRMQDKISRLVSIQKNGITLVDSESMRDTLIDLHNYSAMAIMLLDENKSDDTKSDDTKSDDTKSDDTKSDDTPNIPEKHKRVLKIIEEEKNINLGLHING